MDSTRVLPCQILAVGVVVTVPYVRFAIGHAVGRLAQRLACAVARLANLPIIHFTLSLAVIQRA